MTVMKTTGPTFAALVAALLCWSCSDDEPAGREGGPCYGNGTCDAGLTCASNICVRLPDGGPDAARGDLGPGDLGPGDAPGPDGPVPDSAVADTGEGPPSYAEQEPNDGNPADAVNAVSIPTVITGAIGSANDQDVFAFDALAGDRLTVTVSGSGGLQPHLAVFGKASLGLPAAVNAGQGSESLCEYYVLKPGKHFIAVRDRRNVGGSPAGVGDPSMTYTISALPLTRQPLSASVGSQTPAEIAPPGTIRVFAFTATSGTDMEITVLAERLAPPSDVDSRLSLFFPAQGVYMNTNDDLDATTTDSLLQGNMAFSGTYHAVVENVASAGTDLRIALQLTAK